MCLCVRQAQSLEKLSIVAGSKLTDQSEDVDFTRSCLSHLWRELEQARQQVESASVGHADHYVSDPAVR